jgi:Uma2 family endonuclease
MPPTQQKAPVPETIAGLLEHLGNVSPARVRLRPWPGTATEEDLLDLMSRTDRLYELVDGVLVEKIMGYLESALAGDLIRLLGRFLDKHNLGSLSAPDGTLRLMPDLVRIPDVAFVRWEKLPGRQRPREPIPDLVPDLAVEVLSEGNTLGEMKRKLKDYFLAGVQLVWFVDPDERTVEVFTAPDRSLTLTEKDTLDGDDVLPGLALPVKEVFAFTPPVAESGQTGKRRQNRPRKKPKKRSDS